ncbi:MAG: RlmE family RNA methyltransferase [Planctomycetota bacterium]
MAKRVLHDEYFKKAKADGYAARSAYKLLEIQKRHRLLRAGDRVLDLGCAPGSWMQVTAEIIGDNGRLVGIDLKPVRLSLPGNVTTIVGDIEQTPADDLFDIAGGAFDVVLSDMAPNTSGHGDDLVSARLCREVLSVAMRTLREGGKLAMKILEGSEYPGVLRETKDVFRAAKGLKPRATRDASREMFIIGEGFRAPERDL